MPSNWRPQHSVRSGRFDEWDSLLQARLKASPDELAYVRSSAQLAAFRGQFEKSREIMKTLIDKGQATQNDLNGYAWNALYLPGPIAPDAIEAGQRASDLSKNAIWEILHTLACVDAQAGKAGEAREILLKAMDAAQIDEPNSFMWLGFWMIAEQYGILDAAEKMYKRVEKTDQDIAISSYQLAQRHLAAMAKPAQSP